MQPAGTYTLGIWAKIGYSEASGSLDVWNNISVNIIGDPGVIVSDLTMDNFDHTIGLATTYRWEDFSDLGGGDNGFSLVALNRHGLGGLLPREITGGSGMGTDWWSYAEGEVGAPGTEYRYWLRNVTLTYDGCGGAGEVYFQIGTSGITRGGGDVTADRIYFGEDEPIALRGDDSYQISSRPDFVFPEPGGLPHWLCRRSPVQCKSC